MDEILARAAQRIITQYETDYDAPKAVWAMHKALVSRGLMTLAMTLEERWAACRVPEDARWLIMSFSWVCVVA
jgi:hypothetical protein